MLSLLPNEGKLTEARKQREVRRKSNKEEEAP
jgi:hypothetical protein